MKKLLIAVLFLGGMTAQANTVTDLDHTTERGPRYNVPQSITFTERGITFEVYTNGKFDFTQRGNRYQTRTQGRRGFNQGTPGHAYSVKYPYRYNTFVKYNRYGEIYKVGRNLIDYNRRGKVRQIGSVALRYNNGRLDRVGDMKVIYNRRGRIIDLVDYNYRTHRAQRANGRNIKIKKNKKIRVRG